MERARITFARAAGLAVIAVAGALALPAGGHAATTAAGSSLGDMYTPWVPPGSPGQSGGRSGQPPTVGPGAHRAASAPSGGTAGQPAAVVAAAHQIAALRGQGKLPAGVAPAGVAVTARSLRTGRTALAARARTNAPVTPRVNTGWLFLAFLAIGCGFVLRPRGNIAT